MKNNQKLISVTRRDLNPAVQAVQSTHAMIDFIIAYPGDARQWHTNSNYLAQLSCKDENELEELAKKAEQKNIKVIRFYEPDLDNQLTAIALEPSEESRKITSSLPLMLKEKKLELQAA